MSLSNDLISQFVKATKDDKKTSNETTLLGTVVFDGRYYVKLDGSDQLTPIATTTDVHEDERVTVMIKNHTATVTGNMSSPAARTDDVKDIADEVSEFEIVMAYKVTTEDLEAVNATIQALRAKVAKFDSMESLNADIDNLEAKFADLEYVDADTVKAINAEIESLEAKFGEFTDISTEDLDAMNADIANLKGYTADFTYVSADVLNAFKAAIEDLEVKKLSAEQADLKYANIDFSNIDQAAITKIFSESGIIEDLIVSEGKITGELVGVTIKGDLIEGGTVKADKLVVKGSDGLYYKLNVEAGATTSEEVTEEELQNGLHGTAIIAKTITAEKIAVDDLVAFDATIGGFNITTKAIYSGVKESIDNTTQGIYMDSEGQIAIGDGDNYLRYFKDGEGNYKLEISSAKTVRIGGRNLIRNSSNLIFDNYKFEDVSLVVTYDGEGNTEVQSNAVFAEDDDAGNVEVDSTILEVSEEDGDVVAESYLDINSGETAEMKTLTIGGVKFEVVDNKARTELYAMIGDLADLITDDTSNLVAAINEACTKGGGGGGGSGSANNAVLTVTNTSGWLSKSVAQGSACNVSFTWSSIEAEMSTGNGVMTVYVNGALKLTKEISQGDVVVNVGDYLTVGSNTVRVRVSDVYGNILTINCNVTLIALSLSSTFDAGAIYSGPIAFTYVPSGNVVKNMEFWLDGTLIGTDSVSVSNRQITFNIPAQTHGAHSLEVFCTASVEGDTIESNHLRYDIICTEEGNATPIIASSFAGVTVEQYDTIKISYRVYDPNGLTTVITQEDGNSSVPLTVDRTEQTWSYLANNIGTITLTIRCGAVYKSFTITVTESEMDVSAETQNLALYLTSYGRSNNEDNPGDWSYNDISATFDSFNFVSDGWHLDSDGVTVLRVTGDARLTIPYKAFANDFRSTGKTIEIEFATRDVLNYDAVLFSCMSGGRGLEVTTQRATLTSEQSSIGTQYKEEEHIRLSFVIEKRANNRLLLCYINGILSGSVQYPDNDDFSQPTPVDIVIGSNECTTDIYNIRVYDNDLTRYQILDNWIADTRVGTLMKSRYDRNDIYDDYGQITIDTNKDDLPYLVIESSVLPQFKGDKKTCSGYYIDPVNNANSFIFDGAEIDVQGTSSQYYYVKNYKIKFKGGFNLTTGTVSDTYQLNKNVVPTDTFTFKADVASSEGANNVVLAQLYNDLCPVKTPPQEDDPRVRQTIDGHPIVIFWDNGTGPTFIGKYNFNHDKGTEEVFGFASGDESWEILQNGTDRVGWKSADFSGTDWKNDFEARYPEDNVDTTNLAALAEWLVSTNTEAATGNALAESVTYDGVTYTSDTPEYRLAKYKFELPNHANVDDLVFYYVFTELFLCIDQREKNAFPTRFAEMMRWIMFFYDADSSLGIDNKGNLAFDYYLEDIDYTEAGDPIFNGQGSVLWVNLRNAFYDKIMAEYKRLRTTVRSDGSGKPLISYDVVNGLFETHQGKWSEAIYNEDGYRKCLEPLIVAGDGLYLPMLQGKKEQQRKWWLYNRFRYLDSKYVTGSSMETRITIRAHAKANVKLTSYVNMYGHVYYNAEMVEHRMFRGQEYEFVWAATGAEDPVIGINDADMLTSIGDLSPLMVELIDISKATHLTDLKVGDASSSYENKNLNSITLGNNVLLRTIDLRNCSSLTQAVDASGCTGLEEGYFDGTAITGLSLPNGGGLKILHLPGTVTNLIMRNQTALTEFVMPSYANVSTLWLENVVDVVDAVDIVMAMADASRVRLINVDWTLNSTSILDKLGKMRGMTETGENTDVAVVSGTIYFDTALPISKYLIAKEKFPYLTVTAKSYELDVLAVTPDQVFVTSDNKLFMLTDGGHTTGYTGAEIDQYIDDHVDYSEEE